MHDKRELCEKIRSIYPEIGECGIDVAVDYDEAKKAWIVDLQHGDILNDRGQEGWELIQVSLGEGGVMAFWKRQLRE